MSVIPTYPGVYIEEIPSGVRTIVGVSTSDTAFVGFFKRGPMNKPVRITSFSDFERRFGGLDSRSEASYAIQQYYLNGGQIAWVVRVASGNPTPAKLRMYDENSIPNEALAIEAANEGVWGHNLKISVTRNKSNPDFFNMVVEEFREGSDQEVVNYEQHYNLTMDTTSSNYVQSVINDQSSLIRIPETGLGDPPGEVERLNIEPQYYKYDDEFGDDPFLIFEDADMDDGYGNDGDLPDANALIDGMKTLDTIAPFVFNILCLPAAANLDENQYTQLYTEATKYCEDKRAFLIVDISATVDSVEDMEGWMGSVGQSIRHKNAAVYFPRIEMADSLQNSRPRNVGPSGTLAGIYARTDATRGIWKAPAGTEAILRGATPVVNLNDLENGVLNQLGANVLRILPIYGNLSWGSRTLEGADQLASEWKYIPVRRLALYIEESLYQALRWAVFEPNDEPLWSQLRLNVGSFMHDLFRQGAFQGQSANSAYFVKCDKDTTTQSDIDRGIVNILVGFAPLKPAEFVIVKLQQIAGQSPT